MIPTLIVLGLVAGHWWKTTLVVAAVGWPLLLIATGVGDELDLIVGGSALAVTNAAVGILIHQALWLAVRGMTSVGRRLID